MVQLRMPDVNKVLIAGNLVKDPILRKTTNGTPVTNFSIVSSKKFRDNLGQIREEVCFIGIVTWYKLAETCHQNLSKGSAVLIDGELQSRSWKTDNGSYKNVVEIKANKVQFLDKYDSYHDEEDAEITDNENEKVSESSESRSAIYESDEDTEDPSEEEDLGFSNLKL